VVSRKRQWVPPTACKPCRQQKNKCDAKHAKHAKQQHSRRRTAQREVKAVASAGAVAVVGQVVWEMASKERERWQRQVCTQFTCFAGTKVQILTPEVLRPDAEISDAVLQEEQSLHGTPSLLALLVQKYKY